MPPRQRTDVLGFTPDPRGLLPEVGSPGAAGPSHAFRVQRSADLVNLQVRAYGLDLVADEGGPALLPGDDGGRLEVRFPFQHLGEQAFYEDGDATNPGTEPPGAPPVRALAAYGSRLVFAVPAGERIAYTVEGVLDAMRRLALVVVPLAQPRPPLRWGSRQLADAVVLPGGFGLAVSDEGLALTRVETAFAPTTWSTADLLRAGAQVRAARALFVDEPAGRRVGTFRPPLSELVTELPPLREFSRRPRAPRSDETAIEAPYRLLLSPSTAGGFTHTTAASTAPGDDSRVELWHTRLGTRSVVDGVASVSERPGRQKAVRAVWARDKDGQEPTGHDLLPFRMSLDGFDRVMLVRQSSDPAEAPPEPVDVQKLYLSSLGAWLDLHGAWDVDRYPGTLPTVESWDHRAPMGRDAYVKVTYPGYLFPFGHRASLIKVTERRIAAGPAGPVAWLFQHKFLVVREPVRTYADRELPFKEVRLRPTVTPWIADPLLPGTPFAPRDEDLFWPVVLGQKFRFTLDCLDQDARAVRVQAPLLFVARHLPRPPVSAGDITAEYLTDSTVGADGQSVAFAESRIPGDAAMETVSLSFTGVPGAAGTMRSRPLLSRAQVVVPAMRHLAPAAPPAVVAYAAPYVASGFGGGNAGEVFLEVADGGQVDVSFAGSTETGGGFLAPNLPVRGLSRATGAVGDVATAAAGTMDPAAFFAGLLPKLFGLFELTDLLAAVGLELPAFVSEAVDAVAAMLTDVEALRGAVTGAADRLASEAAGAATQPLKDAAAAARADLLAATATLSTAADQVQAAVQALLDPGAGGAPADPVAALTDLLAQLAAPVDAVAGVLAGHALPASVTALLERPVRALQPVLAAGAVADTVAAVLRFAQGVDPAGLAVRARYDWTTPLRNFSFDEADPSDDDALFVGRAATLRLSVDARASGTGGTGVDVLAELTDFSLNLLPGAPLMRLRFDRLGFRTATGRKADVDLAFGGMEFCGVLGFVQTLRELIPLDGFSDPPFLDVAPEGITAGFDLALPSVAVGVFSLENISLHADARIPFLGEALTVGFSFCTREKPFVLTVMCIGGGGFVGVRLSPKGMVLLEMSLEAGARLSIDLGVASGSVSVMVGIYLRLEADAGSLTGYLRIRGEVDVLGLISASITLELSLTYDFPTGKMIGRASLEIEVDVFLLSFSVTVTCERRLAGSNGDPTMAELMGVEADGSSPAWDDYCTAFADDSGS